MRLRAVLICCLAFHAAGCGHDAVDPAPAATPIEVPRPNLVDGVFPMIEPRVTEGLVPERFTDELPASIAEFEATWGRTGSYPSAHVRRGLCAGDPEIVSRFQRAVNAAATSGDEPAALRETFGRLLEWCERPEQCRWATTAAEAGGGAADVAWVALAQCAGDAVESLFESGGAPAGMLIEYWSGRSWSEGYKPRWNAALVAALEEVARAGDPWQTRSAAVLLSEVGEGAAETLLALHDDLPPGEARDQVASSFSELENPRAKKLFAEYCKKVGDTDAVCQDDWSPLAGLIAPGTEPVADLSDCLEEGLQTLLAEGDADAAYDTSGCLSALLARDRAAAVAQARTILSWNISDMELGERVKWLDAFPEAGQLEQALRDLGLLPRGPLPGTQELRRSVDLHPGEVLVGSGPVHCFDLETDQFPNHHDRLLYDLAEITGLPLDSAVFEEEAPPFEHPDGGWVVAGRVVTSPPPGITEGMPYRLRAYLGGRIYETDVQDFGDWYDLDRVLGLLNAMAEDQGADARVVTLPTSDQTACVLAAPGNAVLAGIEAGLLQVGAGGAAERGREFERQMLERLIEQGDL